MTRPRRFPALERGWGARAACPGGCAPRRRCAAFLGAAGLCLLLGGCGGAAAGGGAMPAVAAAQPQPEVPADAAAPPAPAATEPSAAAASPETALSPAEQYAGVRLANHVTPAMLRPDFWAANRDTTVLMTPAEIETYNAAVAARLVPQDRMLDMAALGADAVPGSEVRRMLANDPQAEASWWINGQPMPENYRQALAQNVHADKVPDTVTPRWGVTAGRVNVRIQPTADFAAQKQNEAFFDRMQQAELYWNEPVVVLHESADGAWYYIAADRMDGWVQKTDVALFGSRQDWLNWQRPADFLVVTANRFRLDYSTAQPALSEAELAMGTVLPLLPDGQAPASLDGRVPYGNYLVQLPVRDASGGVVLATAAVPVSAGVSRGYLPYTQHLLLRQIYEMQGTNYGWGGTQDANDCSGVTGQVYRCFGLHLPRNSQSLSLLPGRRVELTGLDDAARRAALAGMPAGTILCMPGHIVLYLGSDGGQPYGMSAVGGLTMPGAGAQRVLTMLLSDLTLERGGGVTWLQSLTAAVFPQVTA